MAKTKKTQKTNRKPIKPDLAALELEPDAWQKFEKLIKDAAKMGPKPRQGEG